MACTPGDSKCESGSMWTCNGSGTWVVSVACTYGCAPLGGCACMEGETHCKDSLTKTTCTGGIYVDVKCDKPPTNQCVAGACVP